MKHINILVSLDENYIQYLNVMLYSLLYSNPDCYFKVYLLHSAIPESALTETRSILEGVGALIPVQAEDIGLDDAPTTSRYPRRYTTESLLPNICRRMWTRFCTLTRISL